MTGQPERGGTADRRSGKVLADATVDHINSANHTAEPVANDLAISVGNVTGVAEACTATDQEVVAATRHWLQKAVIGLGLCPFAAEPYRGDRIRYRVSGQDSAAGLLEELSQELEALQAANPRECETTLLIHPQVLGDFHDYNDFLDEADAAVRGLGLEGELQIASFHPAYQFAGTHCDDVENCTNRSPYPMLHLLREASVARALVAFPDADQIGARNIRTLRALGKDGWQRLWDKGTVEAGSLPVSPDAEMG